MSPAFGQRILILVPHPDDETVACCATIRRAQAEGALIFTCYLTHGCVAPDEVRPWRRGAHEQRMTQRYAETCLAAEKLGIQPTAWSARPARFLWRQLPQVLEEALTMIEQHQIDQVWVPAYEGGHPDHDGLNAVGACLSTMVSVLEFAEYHFLGGQINNNRFPYPTPETVRFELTPEEREFKAACLALYVSEKRNLSYVRTTHESFRALADYDYRKPPHPGLLWYMRHQWVPFPHPDINRARPSQVCQAIQSLQETTGATQR